jgi:magnesium-transporting ATPase (P-type)
MVTGDNLQTAVTVAKDCEMIDHTQRIIQVEASIIPASIHGAQHLQVLYTDPLAAPEFINGTVCFFIFHVIFLKYFKSNNLFFTFNYFSSITKCR